MRGRKGFTLIELLVVIAIIAILAAILFPVFAKARKAAQASNCQSNLKQIGAAFKMYLSDNNDTYPTNRMGATSDNPLGGTLNNDVPITPVTSIDANGNPIRFANGNYNWVEDLSSYIEAATKASDPMSAWKCQAAQSSWFPTSAPLDASGSPTTCLVTYAMNYNMVEQPEGIIKGASNLMLCREMDRLVQAVLRPTNYSAGNSTLAPISPFLSLNDNGDSSGTSISQVATKPHGSGSMVLFCDGHVKEFDAQFMPNVITSQNGWDKNYSEWFNFNGYSKNPQAMVDSIAITP
jgi:prepilin-type N-terminal cleavage/methylation domain-containing protein/prepilin-type processing-associated H-X9-DG protein